MSHYKHWKSEVDVKKIAWLGLDRAHTVVNTMNDEVLDELNSLLQDYEDKSLTGLVIYSLKEKGFIAGADVHTFSQFKTNEEVVNFLRKGQVVYARLEAMTMPTLAMIDGFCMGGGLELALACDYRIASTSPDTRLALPEILLGFNPGWGGTVRLTRLIGGFNALSTMILTGKSFSAEAAKKLGVIDDAVPRRQLKRAAAAFMMHPPKKHQPSFLQALSNQSVVRLMLASLMRYQVGKRISKAHYPAPYAIIDLWEKEGGIGERAYSQEIESVERLITTGETATNLIRAFLLRERMKGFAKASTFKAKTVHVIGAGVMGGDIAIWCALSGLHVTLQDKTIEQIAPVMSRAFTLYKKVLKKPLLIQAAMDRLIPDVQGDGVCRADVIIEAVFENLNVKREIFKTLEAKAKPDAILATNTSSIPLEQIAEVLKDPSRLVGIHFFNPVARMELVEVVCGEKTSAAVSDAAIAFVNQIKRLPLPVKSSPGFLINRVLMPYLMAAMTLLEEGFSAEKIDSAAKSFGMMMGPVELADTVGLDVCLAVAENLSTYFGGTVPQTLRDMVKKGTLGRKTGKGFYAYKRGKAIKKAAEQDEKTPMLIKRLIDPMTQEAKRCLDEKVVQDADLLDGGMIFATGFAPFRGGPMKYLTSEKVLKKQVKHDVDVVLEV